MTTFPLTTTLEHVHANCMPLSCRLDDAPRKLENSPTHDTPIFYTQILDKLGLEYALYCCAAEPQHKKLWRLYAVWCARRVQHLMLDQQSSVALDVAERYANGHATDNELIASKTAACAASWSSAWSAAKAAAKTAAHAAAWDAANAVADAALSASQTIACAAAWDAAWNAAKDAAWDAAWHAAIDAESQAQADAFRQLVTTGTLP